MQPVRPQFDQPNRCCRPTTAVELLSESRESGHSQLPPSGRGKRLPSSATEDKPREPADHRTPDERRRSMTWAQRLKRVFGIDVTTCVHCGGAVRIVASIEEPTVILAHFEKHGALEQAHYRPAPRAPPAAAA